MEVDSSATTEEIRIEKKEAKSNAMTLELFIVTVETDKRKVKLDAKYFVRTIPLSPYEMARQKLISGPFIISFDQFDGNIRIRPTSVHKTGDEEDIGNYRHYKSSDPAQYRYEIDNKRLMFNRCTQKWEFLIFVLKK